MGLLLLLLLRLVWHCVLVWVCGSFTPQQKKLSQPSDRVKCVDLHPTEPWVLAALYSGYVIIRNWETNALVKQIEVGDLPVRCAKFIPRKQWIVTGSDEMDIRCFNYNTTERVTSFNAHTDYIRGLEVHPTLPYVLSSSDDLQIRMWNWERNWECVVGGAWRVAGGGWRVVVDGGATVWHVRCWARD